MINFKKTAVNLLSAVSALCIAAGATSCNFQGNENKGASLPSGITKTETPVQNNIEDYFDSNNVYRLPEEVGENDELSVIVDMYVPSVMDAYFDADSDLKISEYASSTEGRSVAQNVENSRRRLLGELDGSGLNYELGEKYDTVLGGFEMTVKAKDFNKFNDVLGDYATLIVGDVYAPCETEVVTNDVDVYETGIFDSSASAYQGDGVVVAVLDTGLDYTHTAFSVDNFTTSNAAFTQENVSEKIDRTSAAQFTAGLSGADVYISKKVPYAYDYADKDPDVFPINSSHGTHVAGVIAGQDDTITGVAPNAQLAIMKVFSDTQEGAKTSWLVAALEDCVTLGVDVINMSLGSGCGFTREVDKENINALYDSVREAGISLIVAAGNDYNATFGSEKNGTNGLTSNPDSGVVGASSTYEAALSVASVDGVKTPYMLNGDHIIYFTEASTSSAKTKHFVDDILSGLGEGVTSHDFPYSVIPGVGRSSDYLLDDYSGQIVLVKRGVTTFEEKVRIALKEKKAAGIIIYNNISGTISMSVGKDIGAVCSISQDEGERLAESGSGILRISKEQVAGPFMSDFSSWGPTSDLKIKPEITAHGGEILSAIPGQAYDRLSGTSMACPNQAGATALIRQYVKYGTDSQGAKIFGDLSTTEVTARVNQLMMSTTDIVYNKNGLPYAVRKQGSGLVNISKAQNSASYITTYDASGAEMDKTKLELGDDKQKTGVYTMQFGINNVTGQSVTYDVNGLIMTEGVSKVYTSHGDTTVTQDGKMLQASTTVTSVEGGDSTGNTVTVKGNSTAKVTVKVELTDEDKKYLDESFAHGMYVEGFITLKMTEAPAGAKKVDMNVPLLAFYGDWTEAPIFDEEYYDTNKDEINAGLDPEDKLMPDAYATRVIGGLYSDYISTLGTYYFKQDPAATQIAASKEHISLSNYQNENSSTINSIRSVTAGLLRNAKRVDISVTEDATGREIFNRTEYNVRKSMSSGSNIYGTNIDVEFSAIEHQLKNNTRYTVTLTAYIDYGADEEQKSVRNTFQFPVFIDFEAPVVTGVEYRTEYDSSTKKSRLFADVSIYDNNYAMGVQFGQIVEADPDSGYKLSMNSFGKYITPIYSSFNSTSLVTVDLTDYVARIKNSLGLNYGADGSVDVNYNTNTFVAFVYDYAMNSATYELQLPDEVLELAFNQQEIKLSPNETLNLVDRGNSLITINPIDTWAEVLDYSSDNTEVADVINQTIIAKKSGTTTITATGRNKAGEKVTATLTVKVLSEGEEGYVGGYTVPEVSKFTLTGYKVNKAYYSTSSDDREIGLTGYNADFGGVYALSMYPSESVTLNYTLDSYFPEKAGVTYTVGNSRIATVSEDGTIVAQAEGTTVVSALVTFDGNPTIYTANVSITVKNPYKTMGIYLTSYKGLGGTVEIPDDLGVTIIQSYAFSNYEFVEKDLENGDVIDEEDPYFIKQMYLGEDTITKIVIPEGVEEIQSYAFAKLTALEEVVLPSTLNKIGVGAFLGCEKLSKINFENVKFVNERAFSGCNLSNVDFSSIVAVGNYAFENCKLNHITLPESSQSLGEGAFSGNTTLTSVELKAPKIKVGSRAFQGCTQLLSININASVLSSYAFYGCSSLTDVTLGKDVSVIGEAAFLSTNVSKFRLDRKNTHLTLSEDGGMIYNSDGTRLVLIAPEYVTRTIVVEAEAIAAGAFVGNTTVVSIQAPNAVEIGAYAFARCSNLRRVTMPKVEEIGDYAFFGSSIEQTPDLTNVKSIGYGAFAQTSVKEINIPDGTVIGDYAFAYCVYLTKATLGNNVTIGDYAFYSPINFRYTLEYSKNGANLDPYYTPYTYTVTKQDGTTVNFTYYRYDVSKMSTSALTEVTIGADAVIGNYAFADNGKLAKVNLGDGAKIGAYAFYDCSSLADVNLSKVVTVGEGAFSGRVLNEYRKSIQEPDRIFYALEYEDRDGELVAVRAIYTYLAPVFEEADLTSATEIGDGAFAYNGGLKTVKLGDGIKNIPDYVFANCRSIKNVVLPAMITEVGEYSFFATSLESINLSNVNKIGNSAFGNTLLESVTVAPDAQIGDNAFARCEKLTEAVNLDKAVNIGAYAFYGTALEKLQLSAAETIGDFAFADSSVTSVKLGEKLVKLGENPFYGCAISTFGNVVDGAYGQETQLDFKVSENVKVSGGVLYQLVPTGWELVSYPGLCTDASYTVDDGTVRISARAFADSALKNVTLPTSLKSIGDKAFYGCDNLTIVIFKGYDAPMLEEEFVEGYANYLNLPYSGYYTTYVNDEQVTVEGLGISGFYMWNAVGDPTNYYYGANFVDYIGHNDKQAIMVKPSNGQGYDTFIFSQYFGTTVLGNSAATDETMRVIAMIAALPKATEITLDDEAQIVAARAAYDSLPNLEQQSLVTNIADLTSAESTLAFLKPDPPITPQPTEPEPTMNFAQKHFYIGYIVAGVVLLAFVAYIVVDKVVLKKKRKESSTEENAQE